MRAILVTVFLLVNGYFAYPLSARDVTESDSLDRMSSVQHPIASREMMELVWSCFTTTIGCTWIAIHPNVEFVGHLSRAKRIIRRLYLMVLTLLVPEIMVTWAYRQHLASGEIYENVKKKGIFTSNRELLS